MIDSIILIKYYKKLSLLNLFIKDWILSIREDLIELIKQPINQSFKSIVKRTRILLAIGPAVYPLGAE